MNRLARRTTSRQVSFVFKLAYTTQRHTYSFNKHTTIVNFIECIKHQAYNDFNIDTMYQIEIVEAGHFYNINGRDPERAPALRPSYNTSLKDKYENINYNITFYIRVVNNSRHDTNILNINNIELENEEANIADVPIAQIAS